MGIPWEWELMTKLGMGMGSRVGNNLHGNGNGPYSHENKIPSATGFDDNLVLHRKQQLVKVHCVSKKTGPLLRFEITPTNCA